VGVLNMRQEHLRATLRYHTCSQDSRRNNTDGQHLQGQAAASALPSLDWSRESDNEQLQAWLAGASAGVRSVRASNAGQS
jgi:hypothetical protein